MNLVPVAQKALMAVQSPIQYLSEQQINALTGAFQKFFDESPSPKQYVKRGRHWLTFLVLRSTGARLMEALSIDPDKDIDYRNCELRLLTLKQHRPADRQGKNKKNRPPTRMVPVPANIIAEISNFRLQAAQYLAKGEISQNEVNPFKLNPASFRKMFYRIAAEAKIPKDAGHPHILRHSRAIELLRAGVPVTVTQDLLGHASLMTTAIYLKISNCEAKQILRDRGLI